MPLRVEHAPAGGGVERGNLPVEKAKVYWSESVADGNTTTNTCVGTPDSGYDNVVTLRTSEDGYFAIGPAPVATDATMRREIKIEDGRVSFSVQRGDKVAFSTT